MPPLLHVEQPEAVERRARFSSALAQVDRKLLVVERHVDPALPSGAVRVVMDRPAVKLAVGMNHRPGLGDVAFALGIAVALAEVMADATGALDEDGEEVCRLLLRFGLRAGAFFRRV